MPIQWTLVYRIEFCLPQAVGAGKLSSLVEQADCTATSGRRTGSRNIFSQILENMARVMFCCQQRKTRIPGEMGSYPQFKKGGLTLLHQLQRIDSSRKDIKHRIFLRGPLKDGAI